jgi:hypothetical protein
MAVLSAHVNRLRQLLQIALAANPQRTGLRHAMRTLHRMAGQIRLQNFPEYVVLLAQLMLSRDTWLSVCIGVDQQHILDEWKNVLRVTLHVVRDMRTVPQPGTWPVRLIQVRCTRHPYFRVLILDRTRYRTLWSRRLYQLSSRNKPTFAEMRIPG